MENEILYTDINNLTVNQKILFAFSCGDRLMPVYKKFCLNGNKVFGSKELNRINSILNKGYNIVQEKMQPSFEEAKQIVGECLELTPDSEVISTNESDLAQKPPLCIAYGFDYLYEKDDSNIRNCSDMLLQSLYIVHIGNFIPIEKYNSLISDEISIQSELIFLIRKENLFQIKSFIQSNLFEQFAF